VRLNFSVFLLSVAMAAISFLCSCTFNESKAAIGGSVAILVGFFVVAVIARIGHGQGVYGVIDHFSIYHLLKAREIVSGQANTWLNNGLLAAIAGAGIGGGILVFSKKDLPL
jgi:ABC-2 type transport system permease protein